MSITIEERRNSMYCNHINDPSHYMMSDNTCANCGMLFYQVHDVLEQMETEDEEAKFLHNIELIFATTQRRRHEGL